MDAVQTSWVLYKHLLIRCMLVSLPDGLRWTLPSTCQPFDAASLEVNPWLFMRLQLHQRPPGRNTQPGCPKLLLHRNCEREQIITVVLKSQCNLLRSNRWLIQWVLVLSLADREAVAQGSLTTCLRLYSCPKAVEPGSDPGRPAQKPDTPTTVLSSPPHYRPCASFVVVLTKQFPVTEQTVFMTQYINKSHEYVFTGS